MRAPSVVAAALALASGALAGKVRYLGVAIPGIDFGCDIDGSCPTDTSSVPLLSYKGGDGAGQMKHFAEDDGLNVFRISATWQFVLNNTVDGELDELNWGSYNKVIDACLETGAYCMVDMHNFARYNGGIIGQGGVSDDIFVKLWVQIAEYYRDNDKIIFGLMNEPHDLDVKLWAQTCQKVVTAVRKAGATSQMILLPGTNFASVGTYVSSGSADALAAVTNPDGSTDLLYFDVHKYLDINNSGSHVECTTDNVQAFEDFAAWLRQNKRQAIISETGASMDPSCMTDFCAQNKAISENSDVYIGFVGWGAGSFDTTYILTLTPLGEPGNYTDNKLMIECILDQFTLDPKYAPTPSPISTAAKETPAPTSTTRGGAPSSTNPIFREETAAPSTSANPVTKPSPETSNATGDGESAAPSGARALTGSLLLTVAAFCYMLMAF
ncbi:glycoside hydrolase family 5 protein [Trichoderma cornu-damae]|uniref:Endoglucanase EG-II n=1 Tax=Trichoderma cornu-damae TaxID=654480 RepID=A0A9P8QK98_9HYPO|nr:glycoside hydrolase family 5 protein [Trichoderma cornu-damae]